MNVLNLIMRKANAQQIVRGEKVREYRSFNDHYAQLICKCEDPKDKYNVTGLKQFDRVHFYPYNNKWYLDVEILGLALQKVDDDFIAWQNEIGNECEVEKGSMVFIIRLGKVIATNLE